MWEADGKAQKAPLENPPNFQNQVWKISFIFKGKCGKSPLISKPNVDRCVYVWFFLNKSTNRINKNNGINYI